MGRPAIPSLLRGPAPLQTARIDAIEAVQSVQDLAQSVPLTARKTTFVRIYLGGAAAPLTVEGELRVARQQNGPWTRVPSVGNAILDPARNGSTLAQLQSRRDDIRFSLNFRLPPRFTRAGQLWVRHGRLRDVSTGARVRITDPVGKKNVTFIASPQLRLRVINLQYATGTPPVTFSATANDIAHLESWLRRAYPVPSVSFSSVTVPATAAWPFDSGQANAQVAAIRALDVASGANPRTHYYGLVSDGGGFMRGSATGIPGTPDPSVVASGPTGPASWGWDNDGSYGDWYGGHELGHTFGRFHPGFCGESHDDLAYPFPAGQMANADDAFVGLDVGDTTLGLPVTALPGTAWHDVMTYCATQWVSSYAYRGIRDRLIAEDVLFPGAAPGAVPTAPAATGAAGPDPLVHVAATVNLTGGTGNFELVTPLPSSGQIGPSSAPENTRLTLRVRTRSGDSQDHRVEFKPDLCRLPDEDEVGLVDAILDVDPEATTLELLLDGATVATFDVGVAPAAPARLGLRTAEAEGEEDEGISVSNSMLSWDGESGADGGSSYIVQASTDGGQTWQTLAVGLRQTSLPLDPSDYADAEHVRFRVVTTNGISSTETTTDDLEVDAL